MGVGFPKILPKSRVPEGNDSNASRIRAVKQLKAMATLMNSSRLVLADMTWVRGTMVMKVSLKAT